jgi:hypothetical protein
MSREILRFCKNGFIEKTDGVCYRVIVKPDFTRDSHNFGRNCSTSRINFQAGQLGGLDEPNETNGWEIVKYPGQCTNHENEFLLRSRYYAGLWKAYETGFGWKAKLIKPEFNEDTWCDEVIFYTPEEVEKANSKPQTDLSFLNENKNELTAAAVVAAIVLIIVIARA